MPAYNQENVVRLSIGALLTQELEDGDSVEVIFIDDGSIDSTIAAAEEVLASSSWSHQVIKQDHQGVAAARNAGIAAAGGEIIFFLNADIILQPGALRQHLSWHRAHPDAAAACLGFIVWDPRLSPSVLMEWMNHGGPQNNFDALLGRRLVEPEFFFNAAHSSVKKSVLASNQFDEKFSRYGWEELELARRLQEDGFSLEVLPEVLSLHHHFYSVADVARRQHQAGENLMLYQGLRPADKLVDSQNNVRALKVTILRYTGMLWALLLLTKVACGLNIAAPKLFSWFTAAYFWNGAFHSRK